VFATIWTHTPATWGIFYQICYLQIVGNVVPVNSSSKSLTQSNTETTSDALWKKLADWTDCTEEYYTYKWYTTFTFQIHLQLRKVNLKRCHSSFLQQSNILPQDVRSRIWQEKLKFILTNIKSNNIVYMFKLRLKVLNIK